MKQDKFSKKASNRNREFEKVDLKRKKKANKPHRGNDFKLEDFR
jgi:hypothetical protein